MWIAVPDLFPCPESAFFLQQISDLRIGRKNVLSLKLRHSCLGRQLPGFVDR